MRTDMLLLALALSTAIAAPAPVLAHEPAHVSRMDVTAVEQLALCAYIWGMPLVEAALIRERFTQSPPPGGAAATPINQFKHRRTLAGPEMRVGVGPNNDTIYSLAWVDLAGGPLVVTTPDFGSRYYTFSINFADSSAEQSLGQRTHGGQLPPLFLHGPGYKGPVPAGMVDVPSPTRYMNVAGRILVRSPEEYPQVHALQDKLAIYRWEDWRKGLKVPAPDVPARDIARGPEGTPPALQFYYQLGSVLQDWVVRPQERAIVHQLGRLGISTRGGFNPARLTASEVAAIVRGHDRAKEEVRQASLRLGLERNGWTTNYRGPRFGTDYLLRAAVAKDQIYVAVSEEAVYPIARVDANGRKLDGTHRYRIHFLPGQLPPVDAFWSITAYDDTGFMIPNSAGRYSVGDRTHGLAMDRDGGVTIELSSAPPAAGAAVNWLPVAPKAPFYLMMRLYRPRPDVLDRTWLPPAIERIDG
ncbi:DUF1214 domain-containing protein [Novosphingobium sp. KCTC 2891]|uniref:DUF1254 domain-containing protein n=1 Tax=Novosphingobium sp. KCTC 2891 TaxID=2989730 RepID=UPI002223BD40|nr:DUF1214 domain-containing protein [Novosphingobium sp. KCTC 2891]MCW1384922.1 DUF1214 domain-containing protein [Novosphingobium sp. KCTC 2891]